MNYTKEDVARAKQYLTDFLIKLREIKTTKNKGINVFNAIGMQTQEVKHSAFLAWILDKNASHGLYSKFLQLFLENLYLSEKQEDEIFSGHLSNSEILENSRVTLNDLQRFIQADDIVVETERVVVDAKSRTDIFIRSKSTNTIVIIENKVFTTAHDNQLNRYVNEIGALEKIEKVKIDKKIFIYLTPKGDLPPSEEGDSRNWCLFSYKQILEVVADVLKEIKKLPIKDKSKLKILLEDYVDMVNTNILNENKELQALCRQIHREHKEAIALLMAYRDNIDEVLEFCVDWLKENLPEISVLKYSGKQVGFYTKTAEKIFAKYGCDMILENTHFAYCGSINFKDGPAGLGVGMEKISGREFYWSEAQKAIRNVLAPNKKMGNKFCTLYTEGLLSAEDRRQEVDVIKVKLIERLQMFANKLRAADKLLEEKLLNS